MYELEGALANSLRHVGQSTWRPHLHSVALGALTSCIGLLRAISSGSMWRDEGWTMTVVDRPLRDLVAVLWGQEANMGPYYLAVKAWTLISASDLWVRLFSVLGGALCVLIAAETASRRLGRRAAVVTTVLLVANPMFLSQLTEARSYSWAMALTVGTVAVLPSALEGRGWTRPCLTGIAAGLAAATSFFSLFVIVSFGLLFVLTHHRDRQILIRFAAIAFVGSAVLLPFLHAAMVLGPNAANWIPPFSIASVQPTALDLLGGPFSAALLALGGSVLLHPGALIKSGERRWAFSIAAATPLAFGFLVLYSATVSSAMIPRFLCAVLPLCAIAASAGFVKTDRASEGNICLIVCTLTVLALMPSKPWRDRERPEDLLSAARLLERNVKPGDAILYTHPWARIGLNRYWRPQPDMDVAARSAPSGLLFPEPRSFSETVIRANRANTIWVVGYPNGKWDRSPYPAGPFVAKILSLCGQRSKPIGFGDLKVFRCTPSMMAPALTDNPAK
jgi:hypothetical protein